MTLLESHQWIKCWKCATQYVLPRCLYDAAQCNPDISFYCPYGHGGHFPEKESEAAKLRRERDLLRQQLAERNDAIAEEHRKRIEAERGLKAARKQHKQVKTRIAHGVCPCCNRSFENLARHMTSKHKDYTSNDQGATQST